MSELGTSRGGRATRVSALVLCVAVLCGPLSACMLSPGMRMKATTVQMTSGTGTTPPTEMQIPITEINVAVVKQLREAAAKAIPADLAELFSAPAVYTLGPGDVLQIVVWDHPELAAALGQLPQVAPRPADAPSGFVVDQDGYLQFPYVNRVHVAGLRPDEVQSLIAAELGKEFVQPQVTVRVASYRAKQVYVDGEVRLPGPQNINDVPMTLYEAVNRAGGFTAAADQARMALVRGGKSYSIDLSHLLDRGMNPAGIVLKDGDLLRVTARDDHGVFVMGEVNKPVTALPMKNGKLSLSDALSQAGGLNQSTANAAQVYVIRDSDKQSPQIFHLDATSPVSMMLANQFDLQPNDAVYIDSTGLVRFNRVLNLFLPAINAALTGAIVSK